MQKANYLEAAQCNGGGIYNKSRKRDKNKKNFNCYDQLQRDVFETDFISEHKNGTCGLSTARVIGFGANIINNNSNRGDSGSTRRGSKGKRKGSEAEASEWKELSDSTQQVVVSDRQQQNYLTKHSNSKERNRRYKAHRYSDRSKTNCNSNNNYQNENPTTKSYKPNYLASLGKFPLSHNGEKNSELSLLKRKVVLGNYIRHNIAEQVEEEKENSDDHKSGGKCDCRFNHRGSERKGHLLSELEEIFKKFYSTGSGSINSNLGESVSSSSGRLTARTSEISIDNYVSLVSTHLTSGNAYKATKQLDNNDNDGNEGDCSGKIITATHYFDRIGDANSRGTFIESTTNTATSSSIGHSLFIDDNRANNHHYLQPQESTSSKQHLYSDNSTETTARVLLPAKRREHFHCHQNLRQTAYDNDPNLTIAPATCDDKPSKQRQQQQQPDSEQSLTVVVESAGDELRNATNRNEEDHLVSSLSWGTLDLFALQTAATVEAEATRNDRPTQIASSSSSGGSELNEASVLLDASESPLSFEEAESLLTDELASETGNALTSLADSLCESPGSPNSRQDQQQQYANYFGPHRSINNNYGCSCNCNCCRLHREPSNPLIKGQRRREDEEEGYEANLSTWSISLEQLGNSNSNGSYSCWRPNCCRQQQQEQERQRQRQQQRSPLRETTLGCFCSFTDNSTLSLYCSQDSSLNDYDGDYDDNEQDAERIAGPTAKDSSARGSTPSLESAVLDLNYTSPTNYNRRQHSQSASSNCNQRALQQADSLPPTRTATGSIEQQQRRRRQGKLRSFDEKFKLIIDNQTKENTCCNARNRTTTRTPTTTLATELAHSVLAPIGDNKRVFYDFIKTREQPDKNNCCELKLALCKMGIDGASCSSSELEIASDRRRALAAAKLAQDSRGQSKGGNNNSRSDSAALLVDDSNLTASAVGAGENNNPVAAGKQAATSCSMLEQIDKEKPSAVSASNSSRKNDDDDNRSSSSMRAVKDIAKMSIPSLSALQYLPAQLDLSGRPTQTLAQKPLQQKQQQQQVQQPQRQLQQLPQQQQAFAMGRGRVEVITDSGEDLQHDESCLMHRLCLCNCMSRQQQHRQQEARAGSVEAMSSLGRMRRHTKRSSKLHNTSEATIAKNLAASPTKQKSDSGYKANKMNEQDEENRNENESSNDTNNGEEEDEELSTRSEGIRRGGDNRKMGERQSPSFMDLLKSSAAAVHLTRRAPAHHEALDSVQRHATTNLGSAGDLEASEATVSASSSRNDSDAATTSGSLSCFRSRSTSFTVSEQRRPKSPTINEFGDASAGNEDDDDDDYESPELKRSQSACGPRLPSSEPAKAGSRAAKSYKKFLSPSRLFTSRSPSPQTPSEIVATTSSATQGNLDRDERPSFLNRFSLNRLSGRCSSKKEKKQEPQEAEEKLEQHAAASVGRFSDSNIPATCKSPNLTNSVSISQSNVSSTNQGTSDLFGKNSSLSSSLADDIALPPPIRQQPKPQRKLPQKLPSAPIRRIDQHKQQQFGFNKLANKVAPSLTSVAAADHRTTPKIVLSRAELTACANNNNNSSNLDAHSNRSAQSCDMTRIRRYTANQQQTHHHGQARPSYGSEISADLSTTSDKLSERALSLPTSPRSGRRNYHQDKRQNPSPRLRSSPVPFRSPASESTKIEDGFEVCSVEHFQKHIGNIKNTQDKTQKYLFTTWINHHCPNLIRGDLVEELKDGIKLVGLVANLTRDKEMIIRYDKMKCDPRAYINRMNVTPSSRPRHIENVKLAIDHLREKVGMKLINTNAIDVVNGKPNVVLGLCWNIILHFQFEQNFCKHLENCEDSQFMALEEKLKSWVRYEDARRRLKEWLAAAEVKLSDALGPIIAQSTEELASIGSGNQLGATRPSSASLIDPILQHTNRLEDLMRYFELEEADDPVLGASEHNQGHSGNLIRQSSNLSSQQAQSSLENLRLPTIAGGVICDNRSISSSLLSLGSNSSRMSALQSSKTATYRELFDDFESKCRLLAAMLSANQKEGLMLGAKGLKARLKYITEQRVPQVVSELRMSINRCEMSIQEQEELTGLGEDSSEATNQSKSSDVGDYQEEDDDEDSDYDEAVTSDLAGDKEEGDDEEDQQSDAGGDSTGAETKTLGPEIELSPIELQGEVVEPVAAVELAVAAAPKRAHDEASLTNLTSSSEAPRKKEAGEQSKLVVEETVAREDNSLSQNKNTINKSGDCSSSKNLKNIKQSDAQVAVKSVGSQTSDLHAQPEQQQQLNQQQRGAQAGSSKQQQQEAAAEATAAAAAGVRTWPGLSWLFASNLADEAPSLDSRKAVSQIKKIKHTTSSHKNCKNHKSRSRQQQRQQSHNKHPSRQQQQKQQMASSLLGALKGAKKNEKKLEPYAQDAPDAQDAQVVSYPKAILRKIARAYQRKLSGTLSVFLIFCLACICIVPLVHRDACCDPNQPSQIISEESLSVNERPT